jgi:serine/threonine-protein kinase
MTENRMPEIISHLKTALADRYVIERELGAGGMATVYLAHDVKHNRKVALKVLRPELAAVIGAERFLKEIEVTANLQHPHILPLHDSGEAESFLYYVMPFVEGETLRDKIDREKQLAVDEAVGLTRSVAAALDYAHRREVVHRDIKPENILIHDGQPMVADFGIALAVSEAGGARLTETGLSVGTPHYMSPEQAMGDRELDARSDVYSLGAMLYEMLTGEPPYTGPTAQAIVAKVITEKAPPVTAARPTAPPHVAASIDKSLQKLPADRFASASEFASALANTSFSVAATAAAPAAAPAAGERPRWSRMTIGLAAASAVLLVVALWGWLPSTTQPELVARVNIVFPGEQRIVSYIWGPTATLSPDGSRIVYLGPAVQAAGFQLWSRPLNRLTAEPIPGTVGGYNWNFSPDGKRLAFITGSAVSTLNVVSLTGEPPIALHDSVMWFGGDWGADGMIYFTNPQWSLSRIPAAGGPVEVVSTRDSTQQESIHHWPDVLPNGRGIIFTVGHTAPAATGEYDIAVLDLGSGTHRTLLRGLYARYAVSGHLVFVRSDGVLLAAPFDQDRLELTGPPVPLLEGISVKQWGAVDLAVSESGTLLYVSGANVAPDQIVRVSRHGEEDIVDPEWTGVFGSVELSPDGKRLAVSVVGSDGHHLWVKELPRGPLAKLSFDGNQNYRPAWAPDGLVVSYVSDRDGLWDLYMRRADGSARDEHVLHRERGIEQATWSSDGEWIVFREGGDAGQRDIMAIRPGRDSVPLGLVTTQFDEYNPALSPDGRWLAYVSEETGSPEVYVRPFPNAGDAKWQISSNGGAFPVWAHSGRELFYVNGNNEFIAVSVSSGTTFVVEGSETLFSTQDYKASAQYHPYYTVSPDDQSFYAIKLGAGVGGDMVLVFNWFEELREKVRE